MSMFNRTWLPLGHVGAITLGLSMLHQKGCWFESIWNIVKTPIYCDILISGITF